MYFSVIVTVYKVEPYLKTCVESILSQTFGDFELILVEDGSPDQCPAICDAYCVRDKRVRVLHQENAGPAEARKDGLSVSRGEYIVFVDGDDWIAPRFLERGYELMEKMEADILLFACSKEYGDRSETVYEPVEEGLYEREAIEEQIYPLLLMDERMRHMFYYVSGKIFRRDLAVRNFMRIDGRISLGEDMLGVIPACVEAERIYVSREALNFYRIREHSGAHGFHISRYRQLMLVLKSLKRMERSTPRLPEDFKEQIERYGAYLCFTFMIHCVNDRQYRQIKGIKAKMKHPLLQSCMRRTRFRQVSFKTMVVLYLLRRQWILPAYLFLAFCREVKTRGKSIRKGRRKGWRR